MCDTPVFERLEFSDGSPHILSTSGFLPSQSPKSLHHPQRTLASSSRSVVPVKVDNFFFKPFLAKTQRTTNNNLRGRGEIPSKRNKRCWEFYRTPNAVGGPISLIILLQIHLREREREENSKNKSFSFGDLVLTQMARSRSSMNRWRYLHPSYYLKRPKRLALLFIVFVAATVVVWDRQTLTREHEVG